ncbi:hypothetical protein [Streptomyces sp. NBC_00038]|nr:hypothetical protein [Streptomyces sp. NBC_00038]MCX5563467.1 hypothetical protein [Streptomyces sp. NBC_00038]
MNAGTWSDDGTCAATAALIAVGTDADLALARLRKPSRPEHIA